MSSPIGRFRSSTRGINVRIFLGITMFLTLFASISLLHHILTNFTIIFVELYIILLTISIGVTYLIIFSEARISFSFSIFRRLFKHLSTKYKVIVTIYLWLGIGFIFIYPILHITVQELLPVIETGILAGILCFDLALQLMILNYTLIGPRDLSKEELEKIHPTFDKSNNESDKPSSDQTDIGSDDYDPMDNLSQLDLNEDVENTDVNSTDNSSADESKSNSK